MPIDIKLLIPLIVIQVILALISGIDLIKRDKSLVRGGNKLIWAPIVLFLSIIGPVAYFTLGRKE